MMRSKAIKTCFLLWAFTIGLSTASSTFQDETNLNAVSPPPVVSDQNPHLDCANDPPSGYYQNPPPVEPPAVSSPPPAYHADNPPPAVSYQNPPPIEANPPSGDNIMPPSHGHKHHHHKKPPTNCDIPPASGYNNPTPPPPTGYHNEPPSSGNSPPYGTPTTPTEQPAVQPPSPTEDHNPSIAPSPVESDNPSPTPPFEYHYYPPPSTTIPPSTAPSISPPSIAPIADTPSTTDPDTDPPSTTPPSSHTKPTTPRSKTSSVTGHTSSSPTYFPHLPLFGGTNDFWRGHHHLLLDLFKWWHATVGRGFGRGTNIPWPYMNFQEALSNTRTDGIGALYREGAASLLNSMLNKNFPFTTSDVRDSFLAALHSNKAAAAQAEIFKLANEGRLKPRV